MSVEVDFDKQVERAVCEGIREGIKSKITGYSSPLDKMLTAAIEKHTSAMRNILEDAIGSAVQTAEFRQQVTNAVHSHLAKSLIQRFGGEIEKQVNVLKSDPTTRARITIAIEEIVKSAKSG